MRNDMSIRSCFVLPALAFLAGALAAGAQTTADRPAELCVGGQPNAPVRIEVFSDFQCPACRAFFLETILPVIANYGRDNRVCLIYHDFPLNIHTHARAASRYAVAARQLGTDAWLRVCDALYSEQAAWADNGQIEPVVSRSVSADEMGRLKKLLESPSIERMIDQEAALATQRQIRSTPTFFIVANGREQRVVGGVSYPILRDYLDRLLK